MDKDEKLKQATKKIEIFEQVREIVYGIYTLYQRNPKLFKETVSLTSRLKEDILLDSLDTVDLAIKIERNFNIQISDEEVEGWITVEHIVKCVQKKLK